MSLALNAPDRAAVLTQIAALRRRGWPANTTLQVVAEGLEDAAAAAELRRVAAALDRGERPGSGDVLLELLAAGDTADAAVLEEAARAYSEEVGHRQRRLAFWLPVLVMAAGFFSLATLLGFTLRGTSLYGDVEVPAITALVLEWLGALRWVGPPVVIALLGTGWVLARGASGLSLPARLRLQAAVLSAGVQDEQARALLGSDPLESGRLGKELRAYARVRRSQAGAAAAARAVADWVEQRQRHLARVWAAWAPLVGLWFSWLVLFPIGFALLVPIFNMAGAVG